MTEQEMELAIITAAVEDLLAEGFRLTVDDGEEEAAVEQTVPSITDALYAAVDEAVLYVYKGKAVGMIDFVFGNDGYDVIADNSLWLEPYLARATMLSDEMQEA